MYSCVLFDMDGTLINSYEGIFNAYRYAMEKMGWEFPGNEFVSRAIGAPLPFVFERLCGKTQEESLLAVRHYREYYRQRGKHEMQAYAGMEEALIQLREAGCFLGTATLKREEFAREILEESGLLPYFDAVYGMDERDSLTKAQLIERCLQFAGGRRSETVLVGDSEFDAAGAREAGVDFLAVSYGFGFREPGSLEEHGVWQAAETPSAIPRILLGLEPLPQTTVPLSPTD